VSAREGTCGTGPGRTTARRDRYATAGTNTTKRNYRSNRPGCGSGSADGDQCPDRSVPQALDTFRQVPAGHDDRVVTTTAYPPAAARPLPFASETAGVPAAERLTSVVL
jgi:hypothetical protein